MVRLRFAPSPTGYLHVGGLRTALFSYLYARHHGGKFIFRLEDTDQQRLVEGSEANLLRTLAWAGLKIDEGPGIGGDFGPYRQSERLPIYHQHAQELIQKGHAYYCFCSAERLEAVKLQQKALGLPTRYDGRCRHLTPAEVQQKLAAKEPSVIRMKLPDANEQLVMSDLIRGNVMIESDQLDDQVLIKADGFPTYHLAMVVDDHLMQVTHVVRGEEWLPSYPKHVLLFRYFGWEMPQVAHLPLILNPDRSKLSKRQGDVAVEDFRDQGYLPEALVNFIALLGWNTSDEQEIFSMEELIAKFSFERVGKAGAIFDRNKLDWMNQHYLGKLTLDDLFERLQPFIAQTPYAGADPGKLKKIGGIVHASLVRLKDIEHKLPMFFEESRAALAPEIVEVLKLESSKLVVKALRQEFAQAEELTDEVFKNAVKAVQKTTGIKGKDLWRPMRCAITGEEHGPDLSSVIQVFGREKCVRLLDQVLAL